MQFTFGFPYIDSQSPTQQIGLRVTVSLGFPLAYFYYHATTYFYAVTWILNATKCSVQVTVHKYRWLLPVICRSENISSLEKHNITMNKYVIITKKKINKKGKVRNTEINRNLKISKIFPLCQRHKIFHIKAKWTFMRRG